MLGMTGTEVTPRASYENNATVGVKDNGKRHRHPGHSRASYEYDEV
jgi:hypothetical protein